MPEPMSPLFINFAYALGGGLLTLIFMWMGCYLFNRLVCSFDIGEELAKGNIAVGLLVMGLFIGIGTALGLVIGLGLN